ncbi:MAG: hypothetical protein J6B09_08550 [Clostridia bacterium]|nr:hypothetical protein [Clostridia bacterium]
MINALRGDPCREKEGACGRSRSVKASGRDADPFRHAHEIRGRVQIHSAAPA